MSAILEKTESPYQTDGRLQQMESDSKFITASLRIDIYSMAAKDPKTPKNKRLYGTKNQKVSIVSDRGNVVIVEAKNGFRFSVKKKDIK